MRSHVLKLTALLLITGGGRAGADELPLAVVAEGCDKRVDLQWPDNLPPEAAGYAIARAEQASGPFRRLSVRVFDRPSYSDFLGHNRRRYYYRVGIVASEHAPVSRWSQVVAATPRAATDEQLLSSVQRATLRYFWEYAHPVSGLAYERQRVGVLPQRHGRRVCTIGGSGFGVMALIVGVERGWIVRRQGAARLLKTVRFLQDRADRFHGAWPHWIDGATGRTIPFNAKNGDDGADLVETSYMIQGLLSARKYFHADNAVETEIRRRINRLWQEVEWDFFLRDPSSRRLYWHWSPNWGWKANLPIVGYNECMITYLLAIASPGHAIDARCYYDGWASGRTYVNGNTYYGERLSVGPARGGPLFWTHYSFLGFDPRHWRDRYCNYFENSRSIARIHHAYCTANPADHRGYSEDCWGLTASDTYNGYRANAPGREDGTIAPTAALSSMPYTPRESLAALRCFYDVHGARLWGALGFRDGMNLDHDWYADSYLAIDQGPIICMIENYRSQLCWRMFMANEEIPAALKRIGWTNKK